MSRYLLLFSVLFIIGGGRCDYFTQPKTTYVSLLEKFLIALSTSGRKLEQQITNIPLLSNIKGQNSTLSNVLNQYKDKIRLIFPGTRWCGDGDIAKNEADLGVFKRTDACCRNHDHCNNTIAAQSQAHGLINNGIFTRSLCHCDHEFYSCLKNASSIISKEIGTTYFNILRPQCFDENYPIIGCQKYSRKIFADKKCTQYIFDTSAPEEYEWFDNPDF
ncbi:phospholipase A2-like [Lasioglossum baleicum]|uniref:phospholipase A2-like n=1 Tax=Lasioglossum baleicum TaxID=434251 RepID=UPI003FCE57AE